jgi:2-oxoisovalerate dehydrogenase E2 component (dihydrolipoyl transacylase)
MANFVFHLPDIGEGIAEAEIVAMHVKVGDRIEEDQAVADMMTDKATVEMESPVSGIVRKVAGEPGDIIAIGSMLIEVETEGQEKASKSDVKTSESGLNATDKSDVITSKNLIDLEPSSHSDVMKSSLSYVKQTEKFNEMGDVPKSGTISASPAVRARAKDLGIDLTRVNAAGRHIRHADLDAFLGYHAGQGYRSAASVASRRDETIKVIGMRRKIADNMAASKRHIPHFSYVEEIDMTDVEQMRADLNANRGNRAKLTVLPFMIVAICKAVPEFPMINAHYDDEKGVVTRFGAVNLGIATQTEAGLMVPVLRNAQDMNVWQLANALGGLSDAARSGKARPEDLSGSTLTLTSLGPLGGIATTPVINRPEVAIIGPNKIVQRPVYIGDSIVPRMLMNLSISCDHRVVDGWDAANYVQALKKLLETPVLLFAD